MRATIQISNNFTIFLDADHLINDDGVLLVFNGNKTIGIFKQYIAAWITPEELK